MTQVVMRELRQELAPRASKVEDPAGTGSSAPTAAGERGRMRVVHVTTVSETLAFLTGQISHLQARGFDVSAISSPGPSLESFARQEGISVRPVKLTRRITPFADLVSLGRLWRVLREIRPTLVHGHTPKGGLLAMAGALLAGVPARIYTVHGLPFETARGAKRLLLRWTERLSCLLACEVHSVSDSLSDKLVSERLCPRKKLRLLGKGTINGVDAAGRFVPGPGPSGAAEEIRRRLGIPSQAPVIGFVGRIVRDKGVADLVGAWSELRGEFPELHALVVGSFETEDPVPREAESVLRSDPRIHLAGRVESMPGMYATMDVVVLPTHREGFPQVPLEAAAMEVPVVATRVTGCVDAIVDGETGTLVPARDARALAEAIRGYLRDPALRRRHGRAARARVLRDFRPETRWEAVERAYRGRLGKYPPTGREGSRRVFSPRPLELLIKRIVDLSGAILVLAAAGPILGLIALAIGCTLGRPILFRQRRPGWRGRPFTLLKFRTMRPGQLPDEERTTRLGRFLRHTSFDELPQLWNVLRGDMSLVGPRPLLMEYLDRYTRRQARRHEVKPGVTGWVQVNGRNSLEWHEKFDLDLWYVEHWSIFLDLTILLRTLGRVVHTAGVEGPGNRCMPEFTVRAAGRGPGEERPYFLKGERP